MVWQSCLIMEIFIYLLIIKFRKWFEIYEGNLTSLLIVSKNKKIPLPFLEEDTVKTKR